MIFDPFRAGGLSRPRLPTDLPPGAVPPGARFDPFQPPNPDSFIPGSSRFGLVIMFLCFSFFIFIAN